jgi:hypothetical protein
MSVYLYSSLRVLGMRRVARADWQLLRRAAMGDGTLQSRAGKQTTAYQHSSASRCALQKITLTT